MDQRSNDSSLAKELPSLSADPFVIISIIGAHDDAWLHYIPRLGKKKEKVGLVFAHSKSALSASHLLLAPLPALLAWLFPGSGSALHMASLAPWGACISRRHESLLKPLGLAAALFPEGSGHKQHSEHYYWHIARKFTVIEFHFVLRPGSHPRCGCGVTIWQCEPN
jgi:hypothetical protein